MEDLGEALIKIGIEFSDKGALDKAESFFESLEAAVQSLNDKSAGLKTVLSDLTEGLDLSKVTGLTTLESGFKDIRSEVNGLSKDTESAKKKINDLAEAKKSLSRKVIDAQNAERNPDASLSPEEAAEQKRRAKEKNQDLQGQINRKRRAEVNSEDIKQELDAKKPDVTDTTVKNRDQAQKQEIKDTKDFEARLNKTIGEAKKEKRRIAEQKNKDFQKSFEESKRAKDEAVKAEEKRESNRLAASEKTFKDGVNREIDNSRKAAETKRKESVKAFQDDFKEKQKQQNVLRKEAEQSQRKETEQRIASEKKFLRDQKKRASERAKVDKADTDRFLDSLEKPVKQDEKRKSDGGKVFDKALDSEITKAKKEKERQRKKAVSDFQEDIKQKEKAQEASRKRDEVARKQQRSARRAADKRDDAANLKSRKKRIAGIKAEAKARKEARKRFDKESDAKSLRNRRNRIAQIKRDQRENNRLIKEGVRLVKGGNEFAERRTREQKALNAALKRGLITQKEFNKADKASKKRADRGPRLSGQRLQQRGSEVQAFGRQVGFLGAALVGVFTAPVVAFAKFEQSTQNVIAVLGDLDTAGQKAASFEFLSDVFLRLGERTEFTANQIADAARQLALAGFSSVEIADSIDAVTQLASAGNIGLERAAQISANVGKAFSIDPSNFQRVADVLAEVATNSNTTVETIGESLKLAAPIAANLGQQLEEVTAVIGVLGDAGLDGSLAGTGLSRFLSQLVEESEKVDEALQKVGSSFEAINPEKVGLSDIISELSRLQTIGALDTADFFELFDQRAARSILTAVNQGSDAVEDLLDKANNAAGRAQEIRQQRLDTLQGTTLIAVSALTTSLIELGDLAGTALQPLIAGLTETITSINTFIRENQILASRTITTIGSVGAAFVGLSGIIVSVGFVMRFIGLTRIWQEATLAVNGTTAATVGFRGALVSALATLRAFAVTPFGALITALTVVGGILAAISIQALASKQQTEFFSGLDEDIEKTADALDDTQGVLANLNKELDLLRGFPSATDLEVNLIINGDFPSAKDVEDEVDKLLAAFDEAGNSEKLKSLFDANFDSGFAGGLNTVKEFFKAADDGLKRGVANLGIIDQPNQRINFANGDEAASFSEGAVEESQRSENIRLLKDENDQLLVRADRIKTFRDNATGELVDVNVGFFDTSLDDFDVKSQAKLRQLLEISNRIETLLDSRGEIEFLRNAFAGGETALVTAADQLRKEIAEEEANLLKLDAQVRAAQSTKDPEGLAIAKNLIVATKGLIAQKERLLGVTNAQLSKTEEQINIDAKIKTLEIERDKLISENTAESLKKAEEIKSELKAEAKIRSEINTTIEKNTKLQEENRKEAAKRIKEVEAIQKKQSERGLSSNEKEIQRLEALRDAIKKDLNAKNTAGQVNAQNDLISESKKQIEKDEEVLDKADRGVIDPNSKEGKKLVDNATDRLDKNRAGLDKLEKELIELQGKLNEGINAANTEITFLEGESRADRKKKVDQVRKDLTKATDQRLLGIAKEKKNLAQILALTQKIGQAEIEASSASKFKDEDIKKSPELGQAKKDFEALEQLKLQDKLAKIREDAAKKEKKDKKDKLEGEKKITEQLTSQVKNLRDAAAALQFIRDVQRSRINIAKDIAKRAGNIAIAEAKAIKRGDAEAQVRVAARKAALTAEVGVRGADEELLQPFITPPAKLNAPNAPVPAAAIGRDVTKEINFSIANIEVNADGLDEAEARKLVNEEVGKAVTNAFRKAQNLPPL